MRRSRRQRQRAARSRRIVALVVLVVLAVIGAWLYWRGRHAEVVPATGVAPAATTAQVIQMPVPQGQTQVQSVPLPPVVTTVPAPATSVGAGSVESEAAREASWVASRKEGIRIQQELRAKQVEAKAKATSTTSDTRCVEGQRMKRVANGWVQDGTC